MLSFQLLGPVEIRRREEPVTIRGPKQRGLLAMLLLDAGAVVSRDRLIDGLWGTAAPPGVEHALDAQVSALRRTLAVAGGPALQRKAPGYLLDVDPSTVDVVRFDALVAQGRELLAAGDPAAAATTIAEALSLWSGPALADVRDAAFAATAADELERRRVDALEERVEADLASGQSAGLVSELEALVSQHPFRERLVFALALALYRTGQQSRALAVLATARRQYATELGIAPAASLQRLEHDILVQDPDLLVAPVATLSPAPGAAEAPARTHGRRRWRVRWLAGGAAVTAVIVGSVVAANGGALLPGSAQRNAPRTGGETARGVAPALATIDRGDATTRPRLTLTATPSAAVAGRQGVWVSQASDDEVSLIDPADGTVLARVPVSGAPGAMAVGDGAVWVAKTLDGSVARLDQGSLKVTRTIPVGGVPSALAFADGRLWVADQSGRRVLALDPGSGAVIHSLALPDHPTSLAAEGSGLWVASHDAGTVSLVDPSTAHLISSVQVGGGPAAIAVGGGSVWVANNEDATVSRLDLHDAHVEATVPVNSGPVALAFADGAVWTAGEHAGTVGRLDPVGDTLTQEIPTAGPPVVLASYGHAVWVGTRSAVAAQGGRLTLVADIPPRTVDPGFQFQFGPQLLGVVHDGLVTFDHTSGPRGLQLVPDLALSLPTSTASSTTFEFRLRPGIRYSTGVAVRASDFRRAFERLFRGRSVGSSYFSGLVGAGGCYRDPSRCTLRRGVVTDDRLGTVTFNLSAPDPDFMFRLAAIDYAAPVPPGTPMSDTGMTPVPGTGPYRIVSADAGQIRFERNPQFREWSYAAQPAGNPDVIIWRFGLDRAAEVDAVRQGAADWMFDGIPPGLWPDVRDHDAAQLHVNDIPETDFLFMRTDGPPFDHVLARRALNLAIDRGEIAATYGGGGQAVPTCQILPLSQSPRIPRCPYTRHPGHGPGWSAPDVARARRWVDRSGTSGARISVLGISDGSYPPVAASREAARALAAVGYHVRLRVMTQAAYNGLPDDQQGSFQVYPFGWYADFPSPSAFLETVLPCLGPGPHCTPALRHRIEQARSELAQGRGNGATLWSAIDARATRLALTVPLVTPRSVELTSTRLHDYEYNPLSGFLPAQASVR